MEVIETCEKAGIMHDVGAVFSYLHEFGKKEEYPQISFFDQSV